MVTPVASLFFLRPDTDKRTVQAIKNAITTGQQLSVEILNYRKDGTPFWNRLMLIPIYGSVDRRDVGGGGDGSNTTSSSTSDIGSGGDEVVDSSGASVSRQRMAVREFLGVQQELPTNPVSGSAQQATVDAQAMLEPLSLIGLDMSIESAHAELLDLMASLSNIGADDWSSTAARRKPDVESAAFALCNPRIAGIPLCHASKGFLHLTGYALDEVIGQNISKILRPQRTLGHTNASAAEIELEWLGQLDKEGAAAEVTADGKVRGAGSAQDGLGLEPGRMERKMHCVKKDGTKWWCLLHASPLVTRQGSGKTINAAPAAALPRSAADTAS